MRRTALWALSPSRLGKSISHAEGDAIEAETDVAIADGEFTIISGGGSQARLDQDTSGKGIKAAVSVNIDGGSFNIDAADDAIHSNGSMDINGGDFVISTGDDGLHADDSLTINGGDIRITKSFEGLESALITINGGNFKIMCPATTASMWLEVMDGSGMIPGMGGRQMPGGGPRSGFLCNRLETITCTSTAAISSSKPGEMGSMSTEQ
jgi:hypothetical protein